MATEVGAPYEPAKIPRLYHSWLYLMDCGGGPDPVSGAMPAAAERHFVRCSPRMLVAALIHSLNPTFGAQAPTASQRLPKAKPMPFSHDLCTLTLRTFAVA